TSSARAASPTCTPPLTAWWTSSTARSSSTRKRSSSTARTGPRATGRRGSQRRGGRDLRRRRAGNRCADDSYAARLMNLVSSLLELSHVALDVEASDKKALFERAGAVLEGASGLTRGHVMESLLARERL